MAASEPTSRLSEKTDPLLVALSRYLGTLTLGWDLPLAHVKLTPHVLAPRLFEVDTFGVRLGTDPFRDLNPKSVLYRADLLRGDLPAGSFGRNQPWPA